MLLRSEFCNVSVFWWLFWFLEMIKIYRFPDKMSLFSHFFAPVCFQKFVVIFCFETREQFYYYVFVFCIRML